MKSLLTAILFFGIIAVAEAKHNTLDIKSAVKTDAAVETIWDVITDYDNYDQFLSLVTTSTYRADRFTGEMMILQDLKLNILFLRSKVKLKIDHLDEKAFHSITFKGRTYYTTKPSWINHGSWTISEDKTITLQFELMIRSIFLVPRSVVHSAIQKRIDQVMQEVKAEIERREENNKLSEAFWKDLLPSNEP